MNFIKVSFLITFLLMIFLSFSISYSEENEWNLAIDKNVIRKLTLIKFINTV